MEVDLVTHGACTNLSVWLVTRFISLAEVVPHDLRVLLIQMFHEVQSALTQGLANRVKENEDQVGHVTYNKVVVGQTWHVGWQMTWHLLSPNDFFRGLF